MLIIINLWSILVIVRIEWSPIWAVIILLSQILNLIGYQLSWLSFLTFFHFQLKSSCKILCFIFYFTYICCFLFVIRAFVKLAQELNLYVIIRPGPYICSEWDFGGLPRWSILLDAVIWSNNKKYLYTIDRNFIYVSRKKK